MVSGRALTRRIAVFAGAAALALGVAGCAAPQPDPPQTPAVDMSRYDPEHPGNGLWLIPPEDAVDEIVQAMRKAGSVSYSGGFTELITPENEDEEPFTGRRLSIKFSGDRTTLRAEIAAGKIQVDIVRVDGRTYVHGNGAYAAHTGLAAAEQGFVCTTSAGSLLAEWEPFLDPAALVEELLHASAEVAVIEPAPDDETMDVVLGTSGAPVGHLTVAAVGSPLPSEFVAGDASGDGSFVFTGWGTPVEIVAPENVVEPCG